jgi:hypothetical protein
VARWHQVKDAPARFEAERVDRDGVAVLCVRLEGHAENDPNGVARVKDALDEFGAEQPGIEVTTFDVTKFSNAMDDACSILTGVFGGLPCCWITREWDQQHDGERWDLPEPERMAPTLEAALARVVEWRRDGVCEFTEGSHRTICRWTPRGLLISTGGMEDLWHRNQLVERLLIDEDPPKRVRWPVPDGSGEADEALRLGARLVSSGSVVTEADFSRFATERSLAVNWADSVVELTALQVLDLRGKVFRSEELARVVTALPSLEELRLERDDLDLAELLRLRPTLVVR